MTTDLPTEFPVYYVADDGRITMLPYRSAFDRFVAEVRLEQDLTVAEILAKYHMHPDFESAEAAGGHD